MRGFLALEVRLNILIMTATITPPLGAPGLQRSDPALRLQDYARALRHYLKFVGKGIDRIIFAENSESDIAVLRSIVDASPHAEAVEFCLFNGMDHPANYGRCYSESKLLDHAMRSSSFASSAAEGDFFYKVTGRYLLINIKSMIRSRPLGCNFYCDLRNAQNPWADMRFMGWSKTGYEQVFAGIGDQIREDQNHSRPGEESLHRALSKSLPRPGTVPHLRREPRFDGVRAYDNKNWNEGRQLVVYHLRQTQRILLRRVLL